MTHHKMQDKATGSEGTLIMSARMKSMGLLINVCTGFEEKKERTICKLKSFVKVKRKFSNQQHHVTLHHHSIYRFSFYNRMIFLKIY